MGTDGTGEQRRTSERVQIASSGGHALVAYDDGRSEEIRVVGRDISRGGIGVMQDSSMASGSSCTVTLPVRGGDPLAIRGEVRHSQRIGLPLYKIGIRFERELTDNEFASLELVE